MAGLCGGGAGGVVAGGEIGEHKVTGVGHVGPRPAGCVRLATNKPQIEQNCIRITLQPACR